MGGEVVENALSDALGYYIHEKHPVGGKGMVSW